MIMQSKSHILISIIVPSYNSSDYLERCINSMASQDLPYESYEVIVINDGSTDNTVEILDNLCLRYSFLRYVTTINGGLSQARNRGIQEAVGKYLLFVDSDDSICPYVLKRIFQEMESDNLDMLLLNYLHINSSGTSLEILFQMDKNPRCVISGRDFLLLNAFPPMVWVYGYKRSFLLENSLFMIPIWHEDEEFTPRAIYLAKRIKYYPLLFYNYFQNKDSYMESYKESNLIYMILAMSSLMKFVKSHVMDSKVGEYFKDRIAKTIMQLFKNSIRRGYGNQEEMIEAIVKGDILPLSPKRTSFYFFLFNLSPFLFERYYRFIKRKPRMKTDIVTNTAKK